MKITVRADLDRQVVILSTQAWTATLSPREASERGAKLSKQGQVAAADKTIKILGDDGNTLAVRTPEQARELGQTISVASHVAVGAEA